MAQKPQGRTGDIPDGGNTGDVLTKTDDEIETGVLYGNVAWRSLPAGGGGITEAEADARYVKLLGDSTIDGTIYVTGNVENGTPPPNDYALVNKGWVEEYVGEQIAALPPPGGGTDIDFLPLTGGTMAGNITIPANIIPGNDDVVTRRFVSDALGQTVFKGGDTMTGPLILSGPPTQNLQAATKAYVDDKTAAGGNYVSKTGDTMSGTLTLTGNNTKVLISGGQNESFFEVANGAAGPPTSRSATRLLLARGSSAANDSSIGTSGASNSLGTVWIHGASNSGGVEMWSDVNLNFKANLGEVRSYRPMYAPSFTPNSDLALKTDVAAVDPSAALVAFDALQPIRFRWREADDGRLNWGLSANALEDAAPDAVRRGADGMRAYDISAVLAILTSKVRDLDARLAALH